MRRTSNAVDVNLRDSSPRTYASFHALSAETRASIACSSAGSAKLSERLHIVIMLGRPRTCIAGVICYALGYTLVSGRISWYPLFGMFMVLIAGLLANLYNTCSDLREDSHNLPGRVWLVATIGYRWLRLVTVLLSAVVIGGAAAYGWRYVLLATAVLTGVHQYSFPPLRLKARPILDLLTFSLAVFGPFLLGYFGAMRNVTWPSTAAWLWTGFLILWFSAKGLTKNIPDYRGDRDAKLRTTVTRFPSQRGAAIAAAVMTFIAYASLPVFIVAGAAPLRALAALPWTVVALANSLSMIAKASDQRQANLVLKRDMWLSVGFTVTLLLLSSPTWLSLVAVTFGALILIGSDAFTLDSRRTSDVRGSSDLEQVK
jgi:4-hydroxybenzoate polyprenyltransferase